MTPTLAGRLQTRLLLFIFIGLPVTAVFSQLWFGAIIAVPFMILLWINIVGAVLDPLWIYLQHRRWDRDWPFVFQFASMWFEAIVAVAIILADVVPFLRARDTIPDGVALLGVFVLFSIVFVLSFVALLGVLQIFLIRWRFKGGELGRFSSGAT